MEFQRIADLREALGGRRFLLSVGAGVVNSLLFAFGCMTEGGYITLTLATVGTYIGANVTERIKAMTTGKAQDPA